MSTVVELAGRFRKGLSALVAAVVAAGGVSVLFPALPASWAATATGVVAVLAVVFGPKNTEPLAKAEGDPPVLETPPA